MTEQEIIKYLKENIKDARLRYVGEPSILVGENEQ